MLGDGSDTGRDDRLQIDEQFRNAIHFQAEHGQFVGKLGRGQPLGGYKLIEPTQSEFHGITVCIPFKIDFRLLTVDVAGANRISISDENLVPPQG
jgi:hypothetical protein